MYHSLDVTKIALTIERLERRILERFPDSGLLQVSHELHIIAEESASRTEFIVKPQMLLRCVVAIVLIAALTLFLYGASQINLSERTLQLEEWVTLSDAALNTLVLIGAAVFFLLTVESRIKRRRALESLHQLQSIAHVIDMHQLTKDPDSLETEFSTPASPVRNMTPFELNRYLDYCSELLALTGKLAAVFGQSLNDPEVIASANAIELLTTNLARKVWQKIRTLH